MCGIVCLPFFFFFLLAKQIAAIGLTIMPGFFLKGKLNLFGLEIWGQIIVHSEQFEINLEMTPINWANGWIKVQRAMNDAVRGPKCFIRVAKVSL